MVVVTLKCLKLILLNFRSFQVKAPVTLGNTACRADGKVELKLEVHFGSALSGQTDGVMSNNMHVWNASCKMGKLFMCALHGSIF